MSIRLQATDEELISAKKCHLAYREDSGQAIFNFSAACGQLLKRLAKRKNWTFQGVIKI